MKTTVARTAILFRSLALFAILYQLRLVAGDLADTSVFSATVLAAFGAAIFLARFSIGGRKIRPLAAVVVIALVPWVARAFIAMPRLFFPGRADIVTLGLDSLLLGYDRNSFVSLLPFYWAAASTWFAVRSRRFLRAAVIADAALLVAVFGLTGVSGADAYRWPVVLVALLAGIVFLLALALLFSLPPQAALRNGEKAAAIAVLSLLVFGGGFLFLGPAQQRAAQRGGGLLEPKLFSFDFSQILRLDTEISMGNDLILIVKKDPADSHTLLRRSVLSGYGAKQGFYRIEETDERTHPQRLPSRPLRLNPAQFKAAHMVSQEYYIVNFDAAAFIGMKEPAAIVPYESWDSSSFKSAYAVESLASNATPADLAMPLYGEGGGYAWPGPGELGLTDQEFALYTAYGGDERIRSLAGEITRGAESYGDKVEMIHDRLKYGEYRYSLRPGIAPDGDQLAWFLFQSKKGYCSYYAFAMALMLRSLGIPARVAAGFFIDPETATFDYYPVRADMAHAWVEVPFPGHGWIEFDPTTENLAEGEEFLFSSGIDPSLFERLMREILENRSRLRAKTGGDAANPLAGTRSLARLTAALLGKAALPLLLLSLAAAFAAIRCGCLLRLALRRDRRGKAVCLWKHAQRRLRLAGYRRPSSQGEAEWALRCDGVVAGAYAMYLGTAAARYAPQYHDGDYDSMRGAYRLFDGAYRRAVPRWRRLMAWLLPPLALALGPRRRRAAGLTLLLALVFLIVMDGQAQDNGSDYSTEASDLFDRATEAERSELWERAIDLFNEGAGRFPLDSRFPIALADLYYSRSLYGLAWDEYRKAEAIFPYNPYVLLRLASTASYLNRDKTSVEYLETLLALDPGNREAIGNLGWMYYKVHRLEDGERLLLSAIDYFGETPDLAMTLGTVYSDMYRYDEGKHWYQRAIAQAGPLRNFASVAHYNLSILESRFYRYGLAMDAANASLDLQYRSSGLLARGELHTRQMNLVNAQMDFEAAREIDPSPLAKLSLAQAYLASGRLEEARLYALDCMKVSDHSWMAHYGIDPIRYRRDIHEILYKTYAALARAQRFMPWGTAGEEIRGAFRSLSHSFYSAVHRRLYQKYSLAAGDAYGTRILGPPPLSQFIQYYNAFESYPRRALSWLNRARDFEVSIIPASEGSYSLEAGALLRDRGLVVDALGKLDPVWERDMVSYCYREFARLGDRGAAARLFAMNRGALLQEGISLPVEIRLRYGESGGESAQASERTLLRALAKAGFEQSGGARFALDITLAGSPSGYTAACELTDAEDPANSLHRAIPLRSTSRAGIAGFARELGAFVFRAE